MTVSDNFYDNAGGEIFFTQLVDHFYTGVSADPVLRPMYAGADLTAARRHLTLFLMQYWGGPTTYNDERGHPRLRMRHFPFTIGAIERDRWLHHMLRAVHQSTDDEQVREMLIGYFVPSAEHLRNDTGLPISSSDPRA